MFKVVVMAAGLVLVAGALSANAADIKISRNNIGEPVIVLNGTIVHGDSAVIDALVARTPGLVGIRLNSPGGNMFEAFKIGFMIEAARVPAIVMERQSCASACFLIFMCATERHVHVSSRLGVHGVSDSADAAGSEPSGEESLGSLAADTQQARIAAHCHVPANVIAAMVTVPPSGMYWLSVGDLTAMGAQIWNGGKVIGR